MATKHKKSVKKIYRVKYEVTTLGSCVVYADSPKAAVRAAEEYECDHIEGASAKRVLKRDLKEWEDDDIVNSEDIE